MANIQGFQIPDAALSTVLVGLEVTYRVDTINLTFNGVTGDYDNLPDNQKVQAILRNLIRRTYQQRKRFERRQQIELLPEEDVVI